MELITGHSGTPHISSADIGALLAGVVSEEKYCFGDAPVLALIDANTLSIGASELLLNGRHIRITEPETVDIDSGTVGYYRKDLVVCRYTYDTSTRVETVEWVVVKGTPSNAESSAVDPTTEYMNTSILDGALIVDIPVVRVKLNGLTPTATCLVPEMPSMQELAQSIVDNTAAITTLRNSVSSMFGRSGSIDPNTLTGTGIYYCYASSPNMPLTGFGGMLIVCRANADTVVQLMVLNKAPAAIYARRYTVDGWTQWGQV